MIGVGLLRRAVRWAAGHRQWTVCAAVSFIVGAFPAETFQQVAAGAEAGRTAPLTWGVGRDTFSSAAFTELDLEKRSRRLAADIYRLTGAFPSDERFGLTREIRRSALSVGSNVAEGAGRSTSKEFARFLDIAIGSLRELRFQLSVALDLDMASDASITRLIDNCDSLRAALIHFKRTLFKP